MQEDNPSTDIDPHIQAFEVLSDRISNLEDAVASLTDSARLQERTTYGRLNHRLLGLPCSTTRHKPTERVASRVPGAPASVAALVINFPNLTYENILRPAAGPEGVDAGRQFTDEENARIQAAQARAHPQDFPTMKEANIVSYHLDTIGETIHRAIDKARQHYPSLSGSTIVRHFEYPDTLAFLVVFSTPVEQHEMRDVSFETLCSEGIRLCKDCSDDERPTAAEVFDICPHSAQAYLDFCRWSCSPRDDSERGHLSYPERFLGLKNHIFFDEEGLWNKRTKEFNI